MNKGTSELQDIANILKFKNHTHILDNIQTRQGLNYNVC